MANRKKYHRGRRRRGGGAISTLILIVALIVFCVSGFQLYRILAGYHEGRKEYDQVKEVAVSGDEPDDFAVDFDELLKINADTVGWIRFYPEPTQINYPLVQTDNNDLYLNKTFSANENTVGAIFVNCENSADFTDRNTIIYGHRMKDHSMFHELENYKEKSFWEDNQYFYIYTPDGKELTYHIYAAGVVKDTSDTYLISFADDAAFQDFIDTTVNQSAYATGVDVSTEDTVVTLSTCTVDSNDDRMVVQGVKIAEREVRQGSAE